MKKILLILTTLIALQGYSQSLRHGKGNSGIHATYHRSDFGQAISLGYTNYFQEKLVFNGKLNYEFGTIGLAKFDSYLLIPSLVYTPFHIDNKVFLNLNAGIIVGLENQKALEEIGAKTNLVYGVIVGAEIEGFVSNNVALFGNFHQMFQAGSQFGRWRYQYGLGFRFYFQ